MIQWSGIKKALNSTLGTASFKSLDALVGYWTDTANAAGSLHAKVVELRAKLVTDVGTLNSSINTRQKPRGSIKVFLTTDATVFTTVLNITGKGKINSLAVFAKSTTTASTVIRVTIDGNIICTGRARATDDAWCFAGSEVYLGTDVATVIFGDPTSDARYTSSNFQPSFKTSLKIEQYIPDTSYGSGDSWLVYELE